jgi:hypothetical protein
MSTPIKNLDRAIGPLRDLGLVPAKSENAVTALWRLERSGIFGAVKRALRPPKPSSKRVKDFRTLSSRRWSPASKKWLRSASGSSPR